MARLLLAAVAVVALALLAWLGRPHAVELAPSFETALAAAAERGCWIVAHVRHPERPLGTRMDADSLTDRDFELAARDCVHVRIDAAREPELAAFLVGDGAVLGTALLDERGAPIAALPGFANGAELAALFLRAQARRPALLAARTRLDGDPNDGAARLDLATELFELGALESSELELGHVGRDDPRALALSARLAMHRGQMAVAEQLCRDLHDRYPASPFAAQVRELIDAALGALAK